MKPVLYDGHWGFLLVLGGALGVLSGCTGRVPEPSPGVSHEELSRALAPHLSRSGAGLVAQRTRAGSQRMPFEGRFRSVEVAVRGPDGHPQIQCVTSKAELDELLAKRAR